MEVMHNESLEKARMEMKLLLSEGNPHQCSLGHRPLLCILPIASILMAVNPSLMCS